MFWIGFITGFLACLGIVVIAGYFCLMAIYDTDWEDNHE